MVKCLCLQCMVEVEVGVEGGGGGRHFWTISISEPNFSHYDFPKSRSEQVPGSGFHPRDTSTKNYCGFLGPCWCKKKIDPER